MTDLLTDLNRQIEELQKEILKLQDENSSLKYDISYLESELDRRSCNCDF